NDRVPGAFGIYRSAVARATTLPARGPPCVDLVTQRLNGWEVGAGLGLEQPAEVRRALDPRRHPAERLLRIGGEAAQDRRDQAGVLEGVVADELLDPRADHQSRHA